MEKNVLGFDVSMDATMTVHVLEASQDLLNDLANIRLFQWFVVTQTFFQEIMERTVLDVLKDEIHVANFFPIDFVEKDNVGMAREFTENLQLA